jgi:hypothetical protein
VVIVGPGLSSGVIEQRDLAVWAAAALLAIGMGWSRYAKTRTRNDLLRQLAAMDVERRKKMLSRYNPKGGNGTPAGVAGTLSDHVLTVSGSGDSRAAFSDSSAAGITDPGYTS